MQETTNNNLLIIGGSGFLSGTLSRLALQRGWRVWAVTRGQRPLPEGVTPLVADRKDPAAFRAALDGAGATWDTVVDCIAYDPADAAQDAAELPGRARRLVFVSTDFVYDPPRRRFPQPEDASSYLEGAYGGKKRQAELALAKSAPPELQWTVVRPCHIYGPGSQLGCLPEHGRDPQLLRRLRDGETLRLVGGGHFLQQPVFARDLSASILSLARIPAADRGTFNVCGPEMVESVEFYRLIAKILGVELKVEEVPVSQYLAAHPESVSFLCHRIYSHDRLREVGAEAPCTSLEYGLREHVEWKLRE